MEYEYTSKMEELLYSQEDWLDAENEIEYVSIGEKLFSIFSSEGIFRSFGEGLTDIIMKRMPKDCKDTPKKFLQKSAKNNEVPEFNKNTLKSWFEGTRPKKGEQSREHIYRISFALSLNLDETIYLFQNVYYDRAFDLRNPKEFIYYHGIKNGWSYNQVQEAVAELERVKKEEVNRNGSNLKANAEATIATKLIYTETSSFVKIQEIIDYICNHPHNFYIHNRKAKEVFDKLTEEIRISEEDKKHLNNGTVNKRCGYLARECSYNDYKLKNKDMSSISSMLELLKYGNTDEWAQEEIKQLKNTSLKNMGFIQEISNRFPDEYTFSPKELTYEELRKIIILLYSYKYWFRITYENEKAYGYFEQLSDILFDCNLPGLYYGNPYDWLFLYCSYQELPLETFRAIMKKELLSRARLTES